MADKSYDIATIGAEFGLYGDKPFEFLNKVAALTTDDMALLKDAHEALRFALLDLDNEERYETRKDEYLSSVNVRDRIASRIKEGK